MENGSVHLGKLIAEEMEKKRFINTEMAKKMGVSASTFGHKLKLWDFGSVGELAKVSEILGRNFFIDAETVLSVEIRQHTPPDTPIQKESTDKVIAGIGDILELEKRIGALEKSDQYLTEKIQAFDSVKPILEKLKILYNG